MGKIVHSALLAVVCGGTVFAADQPASRHSLSIYSAAANNGDSLFAPSEPEPGTPGGYAIVRDRRQFDLKPGSNTIQVTDVSRYLDPGALSARATGDAESVDIISQRFEDETLSLDTLVQAHIGHAVEVGVSNGASAGVFSGTLLSNSGGLTIQGADGRITTLTDFNRVTFPDLPKGIAATASLRWEIAAKKAGPATFEIIYPTQGLAWRAEYSGWLSSGNCGLALSGWAQIANRSGTDFKDARVKLIAGEPHRAAAAPAPRVMRAGAPMVASALQAGDSGSAGDYHEYTLSNPVDLANGTLLRAALFPAQTIACQRQYVFEGSRLRANPGMAPISDRGYGSGESPPPIQSTLSFKSDRAMPAGRLRILETASDGSAEFTGEDDIGHTPRGELVTMQLGNAFDLRGERKQTDFQIDKDHRTLSETFAIKLTNGSGAAQTATVREHLYRWNQWSITQSSVKYTKRDADTIDFMLDVPANGNAQVTYTVQYQWSESFK
ncbi:MAG TPA: DUF4139 domain-containing protein [Rudaea sp.]|jgi:hypothetical protein|nr:DUF4139 domain-containing protein [Rudaea sp.]